MSDDSPFPPSKRGTNPRSLANLRPSKPGEPSRNPEGHNGRRRSELIAAFLESPEDTDIGKKLIAKLGLPPGTPRIIAILQREVLAALGKSDLARKGLREQFGGKPRISADLTSSDGSMSPLGPDSVADALRAAIAERSLRQQAAQQPKPPEAPADEPAGAK